MKVTPSETDPTILEYSMEHIAKGNNADVIPMKEGFKIRFGSSTYPREFANSNEVLLFLLGLEEGILQGRKQKSPS